MEDIQLLGRSELFSAFSDAALERIRAAATPVSCDRNFVLF